MLKRTAILLATAAITAPLAAQNPNAPTPGYRGNLEVAGSFVPGSGMRLGSVDQGEVETLQSRVRYTGTFTSDGPVSWSIGGEFERFGFDYERSNLLPDMLGSATLPLGITWKIGSRWMFLGEVSPGVYSDFEDLNGSDFNAPLIAGLSYAVNDSLLLFLQFSLDPRRDIPLVGGPGLRWQINQEWTLSILLPRPRIEFRPGTRWMFYAGGEIVGGAYQLALDHGTERGNADLNDVNMTYRELRAGIGAVWDVGRGFRVEASGGWVFDRRFVVADRDLQWNGEGAPYLRLQLNYRY